MAFLKKTSHYVGTRKTERYQVEPLLSQMIFESGHTNSHCGQTKGINMNYKQLIWPAAAVNMYLKAVKAAVSSTKDEKLLLVMMID